MLTRAGLSLLLLLAGSACARGPQTPELAPAVESTSYGEGALRGLYPAYVTHEISGDLDFSFDGETVIDVHEILEGEYPEGAWFLTASSHAAGMQTEDGQLVTWSADLVPGQYEGPGTYTIDGKRPPDLASSSGIRSAAYFRMVDPRNPEGILQYNQLNQACTLVFGANAATGSLTCPELGLEQDSERTISWTWTWERLPASAASSSPSPQS